MKSHSPVFRCFLVIATAFALLQSTQAQESRGVDFGDHSTQTLLGKAQQAMGAQQPSQAATYANKCIEIYGAQAIQQQNALQSEPVEHSQVFSNWALNDVGYCYLVKAQALEKLGKKEEAIQTYKFLSEKLAYAKVWDPQGWFWAPAAVAEERVKALEFSTL